MEEEDLKPIITEQQEPVTSDSPPCSSSKRPSDLSSPPASPRSKRPKTSEDCTCILCGEEFENRKGLASHARSHLRQIGVIDLLGKSSAIDTVQELVSSGVLQALYPPKNNSTASSSAEPSVTPASSAALARSLAPGQSRTPLSSTSLSPSPAKRTQSPQTPVNRAPKAKKGFRLAVDPLHRKPKPEPVEIEVSTQPKAASITSNSPTPKSPTAVASNSLNAGTAGSHTSKTVVDIGQFLFNFYMLMYAPVDPLLFSINLFVCICSSKFGYILSVSSADVQSPPTVLCDFCGQLFETRKALSCHARAHLRQLGLTWSIKTSPIDLLKEVMMRGEEGKKGSSASSKVMWTPQGSKRSRDSLQSGEPPSNNCASPLDYSMKEKSPSGKSGASHTGEDINTYLLTTVLLV